MRTFVVRVYGSEQSSSPEPGGLAGIVEEISTGVQTMFYDAAELVAILTRPQAGTPGVSMRAAGEKPIVLPPSGPDISDSAEQTSK